VSVRTEARETGRVRLLPPDVARKIAAGEVIDRPASLVRELVDNALDAGASSVELDLSGGGIDRLELNDDGSGMTKEDLELCWLSHATSKIADADDLLKIRTLGFRGEALSSIAAVARLEITTGRGGDEAWRLAVGPAMAADRNDGGGATIEAYHRAQGTSVRVSGLFASYPARKKFLKRPAAEGTLCAQILTDKALAFPSVAFRHFQDGKLKTFLPPAASYKERFGAALLDPQRTSLLHEIAGAGEGFSFTVVVGGSELRRSDRRLQFVFANGRRIQDFGLLQALEYGTAGWFPNGSHPLGAIFVEIDPSLVDFNIHPAKKEARFKDAPAIHRGVSSTLQNFLRRAGIAGTARMAALADDEESGNGVVAPAASAMAPPTPEGAHRRGELFTYPDSKPHFQEQGTSSGRDRVWRTTERETLSAGRTAMEELLAKKPSFAPLPWKDKAETSPDSFVAERVAPSNTERIDSAVGRENVRYLGTAFDLFLLAERGTRLYLIDQHAAHERVLYDALRAKPPVMQELLVPLPFEVDGEDEDRFLTDLKPELQTLGIGLERTGPCDWSVTALPSGYTNPDDKTVEDIRALRSAGEHFASRWLATVACRAAIKDGDYLDSSAAQALAEAALALSEPRCPHGRPVFVEIGLEDLLKGVRRIE